MNNAACAHSKVVLKHLDYPDGTRSDYWECADGCGTRFYPGDADLNIIRLRDKFAGQAMCGMMNGVEDPNGDYIAKNCYEVADEMLAEREKRRNQTTNQTK